MRVIQTDDTEQLQALAKQLAGSKRVAIICGAGISTAAGIPDFRTAATGLFASLKEKNPDLKINSGKDLFHTNLFQVCLACFPDCVTGGGGHSKTHSHHHIGPTAHHS